MTLSIDDISQTIAGRFCAQWTGTPLSNVSLENAPFQAASLPPESYWCDLSVRVASNSQISLGPTGGRAYRMIGSILVNCNTPIGIGKAPCSQLVDQARAIFEGQSFEGSSCHIIVFAGTVPVFVPRNGWFCGMLSLPFWADGFQ